MDGHEALMIRGRTAIRAAKALGIEVPPNTPLEEVEKMVAARQQVLGGDWSARMLTYGIRRKKIAAAYLAGASMGYLASIFSIRRNTVHALIAKEIEFKLRDQVAYERVHKISKLLTPTEASLAMSSISDEDYRDLPVITLAAMMQQAVLANDDALEPESRIGGS